MPGDGRGQGGQDVLDSKGFDQWAGAYERSVSESDTAERYPFAGYQQLLDAVCRMVREGGGETVLDLGFGTGKLTRRLYQEGCRITGIDFSEEMLRLARRHMPRAELIRHDFSRGLPEALFGRRFDFILCTYAIHHLDDGQKLRLIEQLRPLLTPGGALLIGDVAFATRAELEACRAECGAEWDAEECYPVAEELRQAIPELRFFPVSFCAGIMAIPGL